jgi:hypothetical protein
MKDEHRVIYFICKEVPTAKIGIGQGRALVRGLNWIKYIEQRVGASLNQSATPLLAVRLLIFTRSAQKGGVELEERQHGVAKGIAFNAVSVDSSVGGPRVQG